MSRHELVGALHVEHLHHEQLAELADGHALFQASTLQALLGGGFDGDLPVAELLEHGDLGLGTLNGLDGELIVVDGQAWKAEADCTLTRADPAAMTPFAVVVPFAGEHSLRLRGPLAAAELGERLGTSTGKLAEPLAIRIDGSFESVRIRSVPRQARPYPTLAVALGQQHAVTLSEARGSMVGFCFPTALDGAEMIGWHLHFVNSDMRRGGHVLDFELSDATATLDRFSEMYLELPGPEDAPPGEVLDEALLRQLETDG